MQSPLFHEQIPQHSWRTQYRCSERGHLQEPTIEATWDRVALAVSGAETHHRDEWRERFRTILNDFRFLPELGLVLLQSRALGLKGCALCRP